MLFWFCSCICAARYPSVTHHPTFHRTQPRYKHSSTLHDYISSYFPTPLFLLLCFLSLLLLFPVNGCYPTALYSWSVLGLAKNCYTTQPCTKVSATNDLRGPCWAGRTCEDGVLHQDVDHQSFLPRRLPCDIVTIYLVPSFTSGLGCLQLLISITSSLPAGLKGYHHNSYASPGHIISHLSQKDNSLVLSLDQGPRHPVHSPSTPPAAIPS
jgi:hypothetical protein